MFSPVKNIAKFCSSLIDFRGPSWPPAFFYNWYHSSKWRLRDCCPIFFPLPRIRWDMHNYNEQEGQIHSCHFAPVLWGIGAAPTLNSLCCIFFHWLWVNTIMEYPGTGFSRPLRMPDGYNGSFGSDDSTFVHTLPLAWYYRIIPPGVGQGKRKTIFTIFVDRVLVILVSNNKPTVSCFFHF